MDLESLDFEQVDNFIYLGSLINEDNLNREEIKSMIAKGNTAYFANKKLLCSRILSHNSKLKIYKSLIRPVVTYGCGTWTMRKKDEEDLNDLRRKYEFLGH